ncbi:MAG: hypothetical protein IIT60_05785, partial [Muribaculaceae bacterium]|nr:hypothetical protein [Muribaculaceae bacterium]
MLDLDALEVSTTHYWRVVTHQTGYVDSYSDAGEFTTGIREPSPKTTLISPANASEQTANFNFVFSKVDDAESYRVEVAKDRNFSTLVYSSADVVENGDQMTHSMAVDLLGLGTYYWRVVTRAHHCTETASSWRNFKITAQPVGYTEAGYVIKKDID